MKISKEFIIGLISLLSIAAFYWLFTFLQGENIFSDGKTYYVKYQDVEGLMPTKPVTLNGLKVGRVDEIKILNEKDNFHFLVKLKLDKAIDFTKNTTAEIYEPGFLAGKMVKLNLSYEGEVAQDGDTLPALIDKGLLSKLSGELKPTQVKLDSVLISLNQSLKNFNRIADSQTNQSIHSILGKLEGTIAALEKTANSLTSTSNSANQFLNNTNGQLNGLISDAGNMMNAADSTLTKYGAVADKINGLELNQTMSNLENASKSLNEVMSSVEHSNGTLNKLISDAQLYDNLKNTTESLNHLIQDFNEHPDRYIQISVFGKKVKNKSKND